MVAALPFIVALLPFMDARQLIVVSATSETDAGLNSEALGPVCSVCPRLYALCPRLKAADAMSYVLCPMS
eukprot:3370581-Rhodomonas_salina.1